MDGVRILELFFFFVETGVANERTIYPETPSPLRANSSGIFFHVSSKREVRDFPSRNCHPEDLGSNFRSYSSTNAFFPPGTLGASSISTSFSASIRVRCFMPAAFNTETSKIPIKGRKADAVLTTSYFILLTKRKFFCQSPSLSWVKCFHSLTRRLPFFYLNFKRFRICCLGLAHKRQCTGGHEKNFSANNFMKNHAILLI